MDVRSEPELIQEIEQLRRELARREREAADNERQLERDAADLRDTFVVADVLDALTTDRPCRPASAFSIAREIIVAESGEQFDPRVVQAQGLIPDDVFEQIRDEIEGSAYR